MKSLLAVVGILLLAGSVFAQQTADPVEAAKKEKQRREELAKQGKKAKVYTAEDLERVKDKLALENTSVDTTTEETAGAPAQEASAPQATSPGLNEAQSQLQLVEQELSRLKQQKEQQQADLEQARNAVNQSGGGARSANPAITFQQARDAQARLDQTDIAIQKTETKLQEAQRRVDEERKKAEASRKDAEANKEKPPAPPETPQQENPDNKSDQQ